jgi:hypothetical protein
MNEKEIVLIIAGLIFLLACIYVLFFRRDDAAEQYERGVDEINEHNRMAVAMKAFTTGKTVIGNVDDEGNLEMTVLDDK